ncbi:hypothetical protein ACPPVO_30675 [Dactylosporangium sp. McL0621]|uniref:hypothetical protein n=1 Tax=Dactylosporangium sp. McL0621 TaxID=3415678 RepID=UPI003CEAB48A
MATDIIAAVDEAAANVLLQRGEQALGTRSASGSAALGPFGAAYSASANLTGGVLRLVAPGTAAVDDVAVHYTLSLKLTLDLSFLDFCLPRICIPTPFGDICTPKICLGFPTITVPVSFSSTAVVSADFGLSVTLAGGDWVVALVIQQVRKLDLGAAATALVLAIGGAVAAAVAAVPFIGPLLALAVGVIMAAFGVASITGLLGTVVNLFVAGLTIELTRRSQVITLPAAGPNDPAVPFTIAALAAEVQSTGEDELVLSADL